MIILDPLYDTREISQKSVCLCIRS